MNPKIYLAPMSGITDLPFRLISREFGAEQCFFEMLDAKITLCDHPASRRPLKTIKQDTPIAAQLVGSDPLVMLDAAEKLRTLVDISFLDINSACPVKKIIKKDAGAALLQNTATLGKIINVLSSSLPIPITVKLRTGFDKRDIKKCVNTAELCEANGASVIFIHGRTRSQGYSGIIDYESIKAVKDAVRIPVMGSGNIFAPLMAKKMLDETGCDGILVARGALGNPWLFRNIEHYLHKGEMRHRPPLEVREKVLAKHLGYIERYNDMTDTNRKGYMGKVTKWYLKGDVSFSHNGQT
jgi:nifR3 family TIM-barrel protein